MTWDISLNISTQGYNVRNTFIVMGYLSNTYWWQFETHIYHLSRQVSNEIYAETAGRGIYFYWIPVYEGDKYGQRIATKYVLLLAYYEFKMGSFSMY